MNAEIHYQEKTKLMFPAPLIPDVDNANDLVLFFLLKLLNYYKLLLAQDCISMQRRPSTSTLIVKGKFAGVTLNSLEQFTYLGSNIALFIKEVGKHGPPSNAYT